MTLAIASLRDGHAFQARLFWRKALGLLVPDPAIVKVAFERGPKGFDDIWVEYASGRGYNDQRGAPLRRQHIQCKWHVNGGEYGYEHLMDPDFINAASVSLLERAKAAQLKHAPEGLGTRFTLLSNWRLATKDPLNKAVNMRDGAVRIDRLFDGSGPNSATGKLREAWCDHLELDEEGLRKLVQTLGFGVEAATLLDLRDQLDLQLQLHGMRRVPENEDTCWYDDLTYQWLAQGRIEFEGPQFRDACRQQGLFEQVPKPYFAVGVKSFEHHVDHLEERCTDVLDVVQYFDQRPIRSNADWASTLYPRLKDFLIAGARQHGNLRLILDAHVTLAFAAGSVLNIKLGHHVELEQRVLNRVIWHATDAAPDPSWPAWNFEHEVLDSPEEDLIVGVSLTHDVAPAVRAQFASLTGASRLLLASPMGGPGSRVVASGAHAFQLAEALAVKINQMKRPGKTVHLFVAAPNGFAFYLGQRQPSLGRTTLYEYDFEGVGAGGYQPSLTLPIPAHLLSGSQT